MKTVPYFSRTPKRRGRKWDVVDVSPARPWRIPSGGMNSLVIVRALLSSPLPSPCLFYGTQQRGSNVPRYVGQFVAWSEIVDTSALLGKICCGLITRVCLSILINILFGRELKVITAL